MWFNMFFYIQDPIPFRIDARCELREEMVRAMRLHFYHPVSGACLWSSEQSDNEELPCFFGIEAGTFELVRFSLPAEVPNKVSIIPGI
ncbi:unnamed protein product [Protopolystoma xenopodis]|uniref:Uncharacterized protein n=1 Tax=Protopolystoma xenopodis TaxID=117903 RepID=A0A3S4ZFW8_9PLAT|nr:unnamed protein product [Protopolystoma xenopodis]